MTTMTSTISTTTLTPPLSPSGSPHNSPRNPQLQKTEVDVTTQLAKSAILQVSQEATQSSATLSKPNSGNNSPRGSQVSEAEGEVNNLGKTTLVKTSEEVQQASLSEAETMAILKRSSPTKLEKSQVFQGFTRSITESTSSKPNSSPNSPRESQALPSLLKTPEANSEEDAESYILLPKEQKDQLLKLAQDLPLCKNNNNLKISLNKILGGGIEVLPEKEKRLSHYTILEKLSNESSILADKTTKLCEFLGEKNFNSEILKAFKANFTLLQEKQNYVQKWVNTELEHLRTRVKQGYVTPLTPEQIAYEAHKLRHALTKGIFEEERMISELKYQANKNRLAKIENYWNSTCLHMAQINKIIECMEIFMDFLPKVQNLKNDAKNLEKIALELQEAHKDPTLKYKEKPLRSFFGLEQPIQQEIDFYSGKVKTAPSQRISELFLAHPQVVSRRVESEPRVSEPFKEISNSFLQHISTKSILFENIRVLTEVKTDHVPSLKVIKKRAEELKEKTDFSKIEKELNTKIDPKIQSDSFLSPLTDPKNFQTQASIKKIYSTINSEIDRLYTTLESEWNATCIHQLTAKQKCQLTERLQDIYFPLKDIASNIKTMQMIKRSIRKETFNCNLAYKGYAFLLEIFKDLKVSFLIRNLYPSSKNTTPDCNTSTTTDEILTRNFDIHQGSFLSLYPTIREELESTYNSLSSISGRETIAISSELTEKFTSEELAKVLTPLIEEQKTFIDEIENLCKQIDEDFPALIRELDRTHYAHAYIKANEPLFFDKEKQINSATEAYGTETLAKAWEVGSWLVSSLVSNPSPASNPSSGSYFISPLSAPLAKTTK